MTQRLAILAVLVLLTTGCSTKLPNQASAVAATNVTEPMVGTWASEGEAFLQIVKVDDQIVLSALSNELWRIDISDARISNGSVHFMQRHFLHSGEFSPFNGVDCNSVIRLLDNGNLEFTMTTSETPDGESDILIRIE